MDRDSSALQPVSISLATNDFSCCTTTNGLCPPLLSYLAPLSLFLSLATFYLLLLDAILSLHFTAPPLSHFYHAGPLSFSLPSYVVLFYLFIFFLFPSSPQRGTKPPKFTLPSWRCLSSFCAELRRCSLSLKNENTKWKKKNKINVKLMKLETSADKWQHF